MTKQEADVLSQQRSISDYDYGLQVWVQYGRVLDCAHPANMSSMDTDGHVHWCCNGRKYAGQHIDNVPRN